MRTGHACKGLERILAERGRDYLMDVALYGLHSQIEISGQPYSGMMPGFGQLEDAQIADVLDYTPREVEEQRGLGLSP